MWPSVPFAFIAVGMSILSVARGVAQTKSQPGGAERSQPAPAAVDQDRARAREAEEARLVRQSGPAT